MYAFGSTLSDVTYTDHLHHHGTIWIGHVDQHSMYVFFKTIGTVHVRKWVLI